MNDNEFLSPKIKQSPQAVDKIDNCVTGAVDRFKDCVDQTKTRSTLYFKRLSEWQQEKTEITLRTEKGYHLGNIFDILKD